MVADRNLIRSLLIFVIVAALAGCAGSGPAVEGVWRKVVPPVSSDATPAIKILADGHFAFGNQFHDGQRVWAGGGTYTRAGETYTETVTYHSIPSLVGRTITFKCIFRDGQWYHTADFEAGGEKFHIVEVWERLD